MSLERQDRIDRYIKGEMPEGEQLVFEKDLENDEAMSRQYQETHLIAESIRGVAADQELIEAFRMTKGEDVRMLIEEKRSGRRFLVRAAWIAAAMLLVAVATRIMLLPSPKSMDGLYLTYYEPAKYEEKVSRGVSGEVDEQLKNAFIDYRKGYYIAALRGFGEMPVTPAIRFYSAICHLELNNPEDAISQLLPLVEMGDKCLYFQSAEWYLSMAYLKAHQKDRAISSLKDIVKADGFYAEKAKEILEKMGE